jgi:PAS domain S-box-containing protein
VQDAVSGQTGLLLALNLARLAAGCLIESYPAILVLAPLVTQLGAAYGVDPLQLGVVFLASLELGYLTPLVGLNLFFASCRLDQPIAAIFRAVLPVFLALAAGVLRVTYLPLLSLTLPRRACCADRPRRAGRPRAAPLARAPRSGRTRVQPSELRMASDPRPPPPTAQGPTGIPEALRAALAATLATTPDAALLHDATGAILIANDRARALLGAPHTAGVRGGVPMARRDWATLGAGESRPLASSWRRTDGTALALAVQVVRLPLDGPPLYVCYLRPAAGAAAAASDAAAREAIEARLRLREQQLAIFVDNSPAACFQKDLDGRYQLINAACAELYGMDPTACIGKTDRELFAGGADLFRATDLAALAGGGVYVCEQSVPSAFGTRHVLAHKVPIRDASGQIVGIAGTSVEITELKHAAGLLREAEARLRAIVQGMPVLLDAIDARGQIVAWNSECERVTGYSAAEIIGNPRALELLYPDPAYLEAMLSEARELRHEEYSRILELTAKDGTPRSIEWFNVGARLAIPGWLEWSVGIDITERRRLEAALHEASVLEQRRLGRELHDGLGQELTGLSLLASSLARRHATADAELAAELAALAALAARAIGSCKSIARGLAPVDEPEQGLADALRRLTEAFPGPGGEPAVEFREQSATPPQVSLEACNHLYRIAQEALTNAVRHSGARAVRVELSTGPDLLRLRISDDGRGFAKQPVAATGMGLRTMRHRATAIGARLSIAAGKHGGTVVTCDCPNRAAQPRHRA